MANEQNSNPGETGKNPNREEVVVHSRLDYNIDLGGITIAPGENRLKVGEIRKIEQLPSYGFYADYLDGLPPPKGARPQQPDPMMSSYGWPQPGEQTARIPPPPPPPGDAGLHRVDEPTPDGSPTPDTDDTTRSGRRGLLRR